MPESNFQPIATARLEWRNRTPVSSLFDDPYFCLDQGPAETRHVFLDGNQLTERFRALHPATDFTIGETGFGTGLNFLCAASTFLRHAPATSRLEYLAVEKNPLSVEDLATFLAHWSDQGGLAEALRRHYPPAVPGFHRLSLADGRIGLTLALGEAERMLALARARVDAWFLDGFAPARNPDIWDDRVLSQLARLSRPGTTLATYTAAGRVRRGLEGAGFRIRKAPGFASKRDMLLGVCEGTETSYCSGEKGNALVVGAGLAGATTARALAEHGWRVQVLDGQGVAGGASGMPVGVVYTTASAHPTAQNRFYQSSYLHTLHWFRRHDFPRTRDEGLLDGVVQFPPHERGRKRIRKALASGLWPAELVRRTIRPEDPDAVFFPEGGCIRPAAWCHHLLTHPAVSVHAAQVTGLSRAAETAQWRVHTGEGDFPASVVILANGGGARELAGMESLPLRPFRGQVTLCRATGVSGHWRQPFCHQGYLTPAFNGLHCVGATFEKGNDQPEPAGADDEQNLARLRENLPGQWRELGGEDIAIAGRRAGVRWQSRDFLPLVGPVPGPPGLYLNLAHGSRGITATPLCAEILAALINHTPMPVDMEILDAVVPERFT